MIDELSKLRAEVLRDAEQYCKKMIAEKQQTLTQLAGEQDAQNREKEQQATQCAIRKIEQQQQKRLSTAKNDAFHRLLEGRNALKQETVQQLRCRLSQFVSSPEYTDYMKKKLLEAQAISKGHEINVCVFRTEDVQLFDGMSVSVKNAELCGGAVFEVPSLGIIIDNSFETAVHTVMDDFHQIKLDNTLS